LDGTFKENRDIVLSNSEPSMTKRFKAQDASEPIYSVTEPNLTEPANYRGSSYTTVSKKIVEI